MLTWELMGDKLNVLTNMLIITHNTNGAKMEKKENKTIYVIALLLLIGFIIYGYLSGLHFSSNRAVASKMKEMNMSIDEYKLMKQDNYRFYLCQSSDKLVFMSSHRYLGVLWYISDVNTVNISKSPITFDIRGQGKSSSLVYGICTNDKIEELQLTLANNKKFTYKLNSPGLFLYEFQQDEFVWVKLEAVNVNNEMVWSSASAE